MKLSGHLTLEIVDEITGKVINTIEQDNIITDLAYINIINSYVYWNARQIFISTETATPVRTKTSIQCSGTAYQGAGQLPIQAFQNANPPYFVITQRLDSVVTPRTFQTVGLTPNNVGQVVNTTVEPHAYLLLNQPCTQEANQILNLTYRITINNTASSPNLAKSSYIRWNSDLCKALVTGEGVKNQMNVLTSTLANSPLKEYGWRALFLGTRVEGINGNTGQGGIHITQSDFYRNRLYWSFERANGGSAQWSNGKVMNGLLTGKSIFNSANSNIPAADPGNLNSAYSSFQALGYNQTVNLQSAFSYSASPRDDIGPMFLSNNNPSGTGVVQFSEDPWTGTWPTVYRIRITESGPVGTAKFVLGVKNFSSFTRDSNYTYAATEATDHLYIMSSIQPYDKCHGWQLTMPILAWSDVLTVQADNTGVSIINQFTGQHWDFDATTTPALPITAFRQMALDFANNFIYVACSNTGLWRLNVANINSVVITQVSTTPCYAVDVDANGVVYTVMNLATTALTLTSSASNYTANLGFTTVALTTANRLNIYVNKLHPDTRIALAVRGNTFLGAGGPANAVVYWWSLAGGNAGSTGAPDLRTCGENQCAFAWVNGSDSRMWSGTLILLQYGSADGIGANPNDAKIFPDSFYSYNIEYDPETRRTLNGTLMPMGVNLPPYVCQDVWGYANATSSDTRIWNPFNAQSQTSYNNINYTRLKQVAMRNCNMVLSNTALSYIHTNGMNNDISKWIWYKWDGTNWVKAVNYDSTTGTFTDTTGTDTRVTSNTPIPLLDGINLSFTNGASGISFILNEVYDQYVCKGILKTNDSSIYVEANPFYSQPLYERITLTPTVITAPNNHGVVVDGAPGNTNLSAAVSATTVNSLWHALLPDPFVNTMQLFIDGLPVTRHFCEGRDTLPAQNTLLTRQVISYKNGLVLCSTADVNKTLTGYFSYVAKSD